MPGKTGRIVSVLIDGHVHLHDCYSPSTFLESARRNFDLAGQRLGRSALPGVLMLTESEGIDWFGRLARQAAGQTTEDRIPLDPWTIESTPDPAALWATSGDRKLLLLAGRQVVAREGLEVLVLGTTAKISDGLSLEQAMTEGASHGALRVIPWGAGKWLFGRGRLLSGIILAQRMNDDFFLGDGAGPPILLVDPESFRRGGQTRHPRAAGNRSPALSLAGEPGGELRVSACKASWISPGRPRGSRPRCAIPLRA